MRRVLAVLLLCLVPFGGAWAGSDERALFEHFLDRLGQMMRTFPQDQTGFRQIQWTPTATGATATSELLLDLGVDQLTIPLRHEVRRQAGGLRVFTRLDQARLAEDVRAVLAVLMPRPDELVLDVLMEGRDRWRGELRLPQLSFEDEESSGKVAPGRFAFGISFGARGTYSSRFRLELGMIEVRDGEGGGVIMEVEPIEGESGVLGTYRGQPLFWRIKVRGGRVQLEVLGQDGGELMIDGFRFNGEVLPVDGGQMRAGLGAGLVLQRLISSEGEFGPGRFELAFGFMGSDRRTVERLTDLFVDGKFQADELDEETLQVIIDNIKQAVLGRQGRLDLRLLVELAQNRGELLFELGWPEPGRRLETVGDWLQLLNGRLRMEVPLELVDDEDLQQLLATPVAMGFGRIEGGVVRVDLRVEQGVLIGGEQPQPLAALLGELAAMPLMVEAGGGARP